MLREHSDIALSLNTLAALQQAKGDDAAAEALHREALALRRKLLGAGHPTVAFSLNNVARLLKKRGHFVEAEELFREALAIREKKLPTGAVYTANSRVHVGRVLTKLGRYAEAEALLLAARETHRQRPAASQRYAHRALRGLAELYDAWHATEPGQGYDARAAEWRAKLEQWRASTQPTTTQPAAAESPPADG